VLDLPTVGSACVTLALVLDSTSYYRQIAKTLRTKKSKDVSSSSYLYKIMKAILAAMGLIIFSNYVGLAMELVMLVVYVVSLYVICKYKPKNWKLIDFHK
jgi:uncharacterized protein with PQ loop repeat